MACAAWIAVAIVLFASNALAQTPSLTIIAPPPDRRDAIATGISADGRVLSVNATGGTAPSGSSCTWTAAGGYNQFGRGSTLLPRNQTHAISADGSTVVGSWLDSAGLLRPYRYSNGVFAELPLPPNIDGGVANGVSGDGSIVVGGMSGAFTFGRAMLWTAATGTVDMGRAHPGDVFAEFRGISPDGSTVVGVSESPVTETRDGYTWSQGDGWRLLPVPDGISGEYQVYPGAPSNDGSMVIGTVRAVVQGQRDKAVLWRNHQPLDLGTFGDRWLMGAGGFALNGSIILGGGFNIDTQRGHAAIWLDGGGPMFLSDYLLSLGVAVPTGWTLEAASISADGSTIYGRARFRGTNTSYDSLFLATIPSPGVLVLGALSVMFGPRRRAA